MSQCTVPGCDSFKLRALPNKTIGPDMPPTVPLECGSGHVLGIDYTSSLSSLERSIGQLTETVNHWGVNLR